MLKGNVDYQRGLYDLSKDSLNKALEFLVRIPNAEIRELLSVLISNVFLLLESETDDLKVLREKVDGLILESDNYPQSTRPVVLSNLAFLSRFLGE